MTRTEKEDLLKVCRLRLKVAKSDASAVAAKRKADFEAQLATIYSFDRDDVWKQAREIATKTTQEANDTIRRRADELGIPREFMPSLSKPYWFERGENAVRARRVELIRVANSRIDQLHREAIAIIERKSAEIQTKLVTSCLESADAKAFLETMPRAEDLIPTFRMEDIQEQLISTVVDVESDKEQH